MDCLLQIHIVNVREFIRSIGFVQFKTFCMDEISVRMFDG